MLKQDIRNLTTESLDAFLLSCNEKPFRRKQLESWLWKQFVFSFDEMKNLPGPLLEKLKEHYTLTVCDVNALAESEDGTIKMAFRFADGLVAEGVLIPSPDRLTACLSTQVGCPVKCTFCATGTMGFKRNLTAAEMYAHFIRLNRLAEERFGKPLTNIVIMGMGEPLLNYEEVMRFIGILSSDIGLNFSQRRITLSTVGIPDAIRRLADDKVRFNLALSLHACKDALRAHLIPVAEKYKIILIMDALQYYYAVTKNIVTFEYLLLGGVNDSPLDAMQLAKMCRRVPSKVNLIPFNAYEGSVFKSSSERAVDAFVRTLEAEGVNVMLRKSRGGTIGAACGQLAVKMLRNKQ